MRSVVRITAGLCLAKIVQQAADLRVHLWNLVVYDGQCPLSRILWCDCVRVVAIRAKVNYILLSSRITSAHLLICAALQVICAGARGRGTDRTIPCPHEFIVQTVVVRFCDTCQLLRAPRFTLGLMLSLEGVELVKQAAVLDLMHPAVNIFALAEPRILTFAQEVVDEGVRLGEQNLAR